MLGMMNSPTNDVEFYAAKPSNGDEKAQVLHAFSDVKEKSHVSYSKDGRKLIDGKASKTDPPSLWNDTFIRRRIQIIADSSIDHADESPSAEEDKEQTTSSS